MALTSWPFSFVKISFVRSNSIFAADNFAILASILKKYSYIEKVKSDPLQITNFENKPVIPDQQTVRLTLQSF